MPWMELVPFCSMYSFSFRLLALLFLLLYTLLKEDTTFGFTFSQIPADQLRRTRLVCVRREHLVVYLARITLLCE